MAFSSGLRQDITHQGKKQEKMKRIKHHAILVFKGQTEEELFEKETEQAQSKM